MKKVVLFSKCTCDAILFYFILKITSVKCLPLLSAHLRRRLQKLCIIQRIISCQMEIISWQMASFNCSSDPGQF